jgi:signal transduction histidine kinase/DNA-binding NarL/FixJ family response regulator/HAMP domain-containing protein
LSVNRALSVDRLLSVDRPQHNLIPMKIPTFSKLATKVAGKLPLRTVLIVPFVVQIVGTVGLVGYLSFKSGEESVENLAYQLMTQVGERISDRLTTYLNAPQEVVAANHLAVQQGTFDIKDFEQLQQQFWQQTTLNSLPQSIFFANELGEFIGYGRLESEEIVRQAEKVTGEKLSLGTRYLMRAKSRDSGKRKYYLVDAKGNPTKLIYTVPIDNQTTAWYRDAKVTRQQSWSSIAVYKSLPTLGIFALAPIYDDARKGQGVFVSDFTLSGISTFLEKLKFSQSGQTFIMEHSGNLVASSTLEIPFVKQAKGEPMRLLAANSKNTITRDIARQITNQFGNLNALQTTQQLTVIINHSRHFVRVTPYRDKYGLAWLVVVVVPASDFIEQIHANSHTTILFCIAALVGSTTVGIFSARWVTKPILHLNTVAKDIARGAWHKSIELERADELGQLAKTFNQMSGQLQQSFGELQSLNEALAQSESKLNQILEAMPVGVAVHNITGQIIYVNQMARQLLEINETLLSAQIEQLAVTYHIYQAETEQLYPAADLPIVRSLKGEQVRLDDLEIRFPDRLFPAEVYSMPLFDETGQIVGAIAAFADITERKQAEKLLANYNRTLAAEVRERTAELALTNSQLEQEICERKQTEIALAAAKEAAEAASLAKSTFLANMSHELRTPLNGIMGYAQILQLDQDCTAKQQQGVEIIYKCSEHLLTLINDILSLSKIEANKLELHPEVFGFAEFLEEVSKIFSLKAQQKSIDFTCINLTPLPNSIYADRQRLRQILINFLSNALKFTDKGSVALKVGVTDSSPDQLEMIQHEADFNHLSSGLAYSQKIRFQIEDTGCGISPENLEKIFLPFEQVGDISRHAEGTGLGLAITKNLLYLMKSEICVESTAGVGSKFWFDLNLPATSDLIASNSLKSTERVIGYQGQKQKIMVIEDCWENQSVMINLLEPIGFEVVAAANGETGLKKAVEFQPDLIISDLVMPGMDGLRLIRELRKLPQFQSTTIVAASASVFNEDRQKCLELGYSDFLPKPIQATELLNKIKSYLNLSWIYESGLTRSNLTEAVPLAASPQEMVVPPKEELLALYQAAKSCYVEDVELEISRLQQLQPDYNSFVAMVLELAEDFEYQAIVKLIDIYIS